MAVSARPAQAQTDAGEQTADTAYTPVAKEGDLWTEFGGESFKDKTLREDSPTPLEADLFDVSFRNAKNGFAGGAECRDPAPEETKADEQALAQYLATCPRVPVLYRYVEDEQGTFNWVPVELTGDDEPGFIGSIAWISATEALAVGGTGHYPRREFARRDGESDLDYFRRDLAGQEENASGRARVWRFADDHWSAVDTENLEGPGGIPAGGLNAIDCTPAGKQPECWTGGLAHLHQYKDGSFDRYLGPDSPPRDLPDARFFRFRVREVRFITEFPPFSGAPENSHFSFITANCCSGSPLEDHAQEINFDPKAQRWTYRYPVGTGPSSAVWQLNNGTSNTVNGLIDPWEQLAGQPNATDEQRKQILEALDQPAIKEVQGRTGPSLTRSYYSFVQVGNGVVSEGGPETDNEPSSYIGPFGGVAYPGARSGSLADVAASTTRLVSSDGNEAPWAFPGNHDSIPDWNVGELRSRGRGLAVATNLRNPNRFNGSTTATGYSAQDAGVDSSNPASSSVDPGRADRARQDWGAFLIDSFALNAVDVLDGEGLGWAVGDRGALVRLDEANSQLASEPEPPRLGSPAPAQVSSGPYDALSKPERSGQVGSVPTLMTREPEGEGSVPFAWAGTVANQSGTTPAITEVTMSRDGTEGWAAGGRDGVEPYALFRYRDGRWGECDPLGHLGMPPDPACRGLEALAREGVTGTGVAAMARIPLERDADPSNDDEFEAMALTDGVRRPGESRGSIRLIRYRDGAWNFVDIPGFPSMFEGPNQPNNILDLAFTSPTDGWIVQAASAGVAVNLWHFDGSRWVKCVGNAPVDGSAQECGTGAGNAFPRTSPPGPGGILPLRGAFATVGKRIYYYGARPYDQGGVSPFGSFGTGTNGVIAYRDPGGDWTTADGGYNPGAEQTGAVPDPTGAIGSVVSLAVREVDGRYEGWALTMMAGSVNIGDAGSNMTLLRLDDAGKWQPYVDPAVQRYLRTPGRGYLAGLPGPGPGIALLTPVNTANPGPRILVFDPELGRFRPLPQPYQSGDPDAALEGADARVNALLPDGRGAFFVSLVAGANGTHHTSFLRYSPEGAPRPVFEEAPVPLAEDTSAMDAAPDGTVWVAAPVGGQLARFDPRLGWDRVRIPGWDRGSVITRPSAISDIAVGPDGEGLAVGEGGRIAEIGQTLRLDPAAGTSCAETPDPPCGTGYDLDAVDIASNGSALAAGRSLSILWRPGPGEGFRIQPKPQAALAARITDVSMASPTEAYLTVSTGQVIQGTLSGETWSWETANDDEHGDTVTKGIPLNGVAVDAESGRGFAVGAHGTILQRSPSDGSWKAIESPVSHHLLSVALPQGGGDGALIGGEDGLLLTWSGRGFDVARPPDNLATSAGPVHSVALLPGSSAGGVEALAAVGLDDPDISASEPTGGTGLGYEGTSVLLRYADGVSGGLGTDSLAALPDSPPARDGELTVAAFGRSDCHGEGLTCEELAGGSDGLNDLVLRRMVGELSDATGEADGPVLGLMTGDITDTPGSAGQSASFKLTSWNDFVAGPLESAGMPVLGAVGPQDVSDGGLNGGWRTAMASRPAPWGAEDPDAFDEVRLEPVPERGTARELPTGGPEANTQDLSADQSTATGGARTHYAADVFLGDQKVARIAVVDTSQGSLAASDPTQNPAELKAGQLDWLDEVTCIRGSSTDALGACTREPGQRAIVVSSTPTYSYGPQSLDGTQIDAASLESVLFRNRVDLVASGHLGWNGRYWAVAPGVHSPCPGSGQPADEDVPVSAEAPCGAPSADAVDEITGPLLRGNEQGLVPFVVASGAGGRFAGSGTADDGYWHGYSLIRMAPPEAGFPSGDPRKVLVEQRAIVDWLALTGPGHVVRPSKKLALSGYMRQPIGTAGSADRSTRLEPISTPAVTHRYDLVEADPNQPWLPRQETGTETEVPNAASNRVGESDPCGPYVCLDPKVGAIDQYSGQVKAGKGNYPRTQAVALLSMGPRSAGYPVTFEPRPSFRPPAPPAPRPAALPAPGNPPQPPQPTQPTVEPLVLPVLPSLTTPVLPPPPAPPVPPPAETQAPLDLNLAPTALDVSPPTAVSQPPTPPVNPAPPSGARREARQRQAAAQKSGADSGDEAGEGVSRAREQGGDLADSPGITDQAMSRHELTALSAREQPSAWARDALLGGGLGLAALVLALGLGTARPTPRRRPTAAPEFNRRR